MDYSCIVFDTAPTGHTLRLLQFPTTLQKGLSKLMSLKGMFGGMLNQLSSLFGAGNGENMQDQLLGKLEQLKVRNLLSYLVPWASRCCETNTPVHALYHSCRYVTQAGLQRSKAELMRQRQSALPTWAACFMCKGWWFTSNPACDPCRL